MSILTCPLTVTIRMSIKQWANRTGPAIFNKCNYSIAEKIKV